jgi:hypothetical protein
MAKVMILCPATQRPIPTGIEADPSEFQRSPVFFAATRCGFCNEDHRWFAREAWVEERLSSPSLAAGRADVVGRIPDTANAASHT